MDEPGTGDPGDDVDVKETLPNPRPGRRVSLQDVGSRSGVSFQTASKVLRGTGTVSEATRERVLSAAADLGYVVNSLASGLASKKTRSIGFIASGLASFVHAPLLLGAEREARRNGYDVLFAFVDDDTRDGARILNKLIERRVDGIVSAAITLQHDATYGALLREAVPSVSTHRIPMGGVPIVGEDWEEPGLLATNHLVERGHRQIASIVGAWDGGLPVGRLAGYANALAAVGEVFDPGLVEVGAWSVEGGYQAMWRLLAGGCRFTAVFSQNDHMAMGAIRALREHGLSVPGDVSFVGCDDVEFTRFIDPPLTTVRLSFENTGEAAVRLLIERLQGKEAIPERTYLPCSLIVRESTRAIA